MMLIKRLNAAIAASVVVGFLLACSGRCFGAEDVLPKLQAKLKAGKPADLNDAKKLLTSLVAPSTSPPVKKPPAANIAVNPSDERIKSVLTAIQVAEAYRGQDDELASKSIQDAIDKLVPQSDPVRDAPFIKLLFQERAQITASARQSYEKAADNSIQRGELLSKDRRYDDAIAAFQQAIDLKQKGVSEATVSKAVEEKSGAEKERDLAKGTWRESIAVALSSLRTLWIWLGYFFIVLLFVIGRNLFGMYSRQTAIAISDGTNGAAANQSAADEALTVAVSTRVQEVSRGRGRRSRVEEGGQADGAAVAALRPVVPDTGNIAPVLQSSASVQFGPFSLNPVQVLNLIVSFFRIPPTRTIAGTVVSAGDHGAMFIGRSTRIRWNPLPSRPEYEWEVASHVPDGLDIKDQVIADVAARIAFDLGSQTYTDEWESFRAHQSALCLIALSRDKQNRDAYFSQARKELQRSLDHDPSNWMARYDLSTLLRTIGEYEVSCQHLLMLRSQVEQALKAVRPSTSLVSSWLGTTQKTSGLVRLGDHLKKDRIFGLEVDYNLALGYIKLTATPGSRASAPDPIVILNGIIKELDGIHPQNSPIPESDKKLFRAVDQLRLYVISAQSAAVVARLDSTDLGERISNSQFREARQYIEGVRTDVAQYQADDDDGQRARSISLAVIENALGRLCAKWFSRIVDARFGVAYDQAKADLAASAEGDEKAPDPVELSQAALRAYWHAIALMPDFVDAYINLGRHYLTARGRADREWPRRAEEALQTALLLSPKNLMTNYLLGKLKSDSAVADYAKAKEHLQMSAPYVFSYARLADIAMKQDRDCATALRYLSQSIALEQRPDYRSRMFVECVLGLLESDDEDERPRKRVVEQAKELAAKLEHEGEDENLKRSGKEALPKLEKALKDFVDAPDCGKKKPPAEQEKQPAAAETKVPPAEEAPKPAAAAKQK